MMPADSAPVVAATSGPAVAEDESVTPAEAAVDSTEPSADGETQPAPVAETSASADEPAPTVVQTVEEAPKPILLWRQARFDGRNNRGHQEKREHHRGGQARSVQGEQRPARNERNANQQTEQGERKAQFRGKGKPNGKDRFKQGDSGKSAGKPPLHAKRPEREERPVNIDMDSPFAKLLALKEQMKK
jgi:ATP-dependent RNA helicase SUPV3L1/SUV3